MNCADGSRHVGPWRERREQMNLSSTDFRYICDLVLDRSAIVLEPGKEYLVESRLTPLARREGLSGLDELIARLRGRSVNGLETRVVEAMTTNETSFFRDLHPFNALQKTILPELLERRSSERTLRIWSAAASSGQEIYSIAMLLREQFPQLAGWKVRLLATDLSDEMVQRANEGLFSQLEVNRGLPAPLLLKYFEKQGAQWRINAEIRSSIEFRRMNLVEQWPRIPDMDVIFMRNVLIYFSVESKRDILAKVRQVLARDGALFMGAAETTFSLDDSFERVQIEKTSCYRLRRSVG